MAQYGFGTGSLFGYRTDVANATPVQFGALHDVSIDFQFSLKELHGQFQFPLAVARSSAKITGKAKLAQITGRLWNDLFFGQTLTTGQKVTSLNETGTVPTAAPYQVSVTNSTTFVEDLGVTDAITGLPLVRVAAAPAVGQYSVNATGTYTFASADQGKAVVVSYSFTLATGGQRINIANQLLGAGPTFKIVLFETYQGKRLQVELNQCISNKLTIPTKIEDFIMNELDFSAFADAAGNLGAISFGEPS